MRKVRLTVSSGVLLLAKETKGYTMGYQWLTYASLRVVDLSQADIAKKLDIHPSTISNEIHCSN